MRSRVEDLRVGNKAVTDKSEIRSYREHARTGLALPFRNTKTPLFMVSSDKKLIPFKERPPPLMVQLLYRCS